MAPLNPQQEAFREHHALQCGFCTPGMLMTTTDLLRKYPLATDDQIREGLSGNLCRCTGYEHIVRAIRAVVGRAALASEASGQRGNSYDVRAPDTRPEPGSSARAEDPA